MTKMLTSEDNYIRMAAAIRDKLKTNTTYLPKEMPDAISSMEVDLKVTNGQIVNYKSSGADIPEKTFVEIVNGPLAEGLSDGGIGSNVVSGLTGLTLPLSIKIDDAKIFIVYYDNSALYGCICDVSGDEPQFSSSTLISNAGDVCVARSARAHTFWAAKVSSTQVAVVYQAKGTAPDTSLYHTYGVVVQISGNTITHGTAIDLSTGSKTYEHCHVAVFSQNKIVFSSNDYSGGSDAVLYTVCSASGSTLTTIYTSTLPSGIGAQGAVFFGMPDDRIVASLGKYEANDYYIVGSVGANSITFGQTYAVSDTSYGFREYDGIAVDSTHMFFTTGIMGYDDAACWGVLLEISGTSVVSHEKLYLGLRDPSYASLDKIDDTHLIVAFTNRNLSVVTISGNSFSYQSATFTAVPGTSVAGGVTVIDSYRAIFFIGNYNKPAYQVISRTILGSLAIRPSQTRIDGITGTTATSSTAGDVWVLDAGA